MLIECPDCKKQISDQAEQCNSCGYSFKLIRAKKEVENARNIGKGLFAIGCLPFILLFMYFIFDTQIKDPSGECKEIAKKYEGKYMLSFCSKEACARSIISNDGASIRQLIANTGNLEIAWTALVTQANVENPKECKLK